MDIHATVPTERNFDFAGGLSELLNIHRLKPFEPAVTAVFAGLFCAVP